jgi:hypothetical protein
METPQALIMHQGTKVQADFYDMLPQGNPTP